MSAWNKFNDTEEEKALLARAPRGYLVRINGSEAQPHIRGPIENFLRSGGGGGFIDTVSHYLICEPHPLAYMIKRWADTGQPVWVRKMIYCGIEKEWQTYATTTPDWNIPGAEYSFSDPREEVENVLSSAEA